MEIAKVKDREKVQDNKISGSTDFFIKNFIAGGVAGCCAKATVAPFDRVKILLQAHHKHFRHLGVKSTLTTVLYKDGVLGLFKGNGAQMIRIFPYAAIQFSSYEYYKNFLRKKLGVNQVTKLASGSLAGMTAVFFTYPLDVIRARLAFQVAGEVIYTGIVDAFKVMINHEGGIKALYKGIVPTMLGMVPYAGLSFYGFETLKVLLLEYYPLVFGKPCPKNDGSVVLILPAKLLCGGLAGAFAQTVSYPLDVARRKMQLAIMLHHGVAKNIKPLKWYQILQRVVQKHGVKRGLYRGLSINYIKVTPMVAVSFTVYELMKEWLGLDVHAEKR